MKIQHLMLLMIAIIAATGYYSQQAFAGTVNSLNMHNSANQYANTAFLAESATLNINTANAEELGMLPGIGAKKAQAIVAYRELNGEFNSIDELVNVKGIGPKMLAKLTDKISV
ncbi:ComEA family DNA-binding protein [Aestuariibacter sp. P117]|uniref:ComEA family DNA-binding protein n=2 Tax=Glaciecola petra TaxID=3075602 RepID=A0ABU2ZMU9_9ALTE|nr:ComEA family DNA-binding protein [Aestuariibacter sp. P117]MDT0593679.1 ComEA family DNA-binding protein [Aestuariibacter sp. P117]